MKCAYPKRVYSALVAQTIDARATTALNAQRGSVQVASAA